MKGCQHSSFELDCQRPNAEIEAMHFAARALETFRLRSFLNKLSAKELDMKIFGCKTRPAVPSGLVPCLMRLLGIKASLFSPAGIG